MEFVGKEEKKADGRKKKAQVGTVLPLPQVEVVHISEDNL